MLDLNFIASILRNQGSLSKLNTVAPVDDILSLDVRRRETIKEAERLKAQRNTVSKEIARMKDNDARQRAIVEMREIGERIKELDDELRQVEGELNALLYEVPNMPHPDVPVGPDESANVISHVGRAATFLSSLLPYESRELGSSTSCAASSAGAASTWGATRRPVQPLDRLDDRCTQEGKRGVHAVRGPRTVHVNTGDANSRTYRDFEDDLWLIHAEYRDNCTWTRTWCEHCRSSSVHALFPARRCRRARRRVASARAPVSKGRDGEVEPAETSDEELQRLRQRRGSVSRVETAYRSCKCVPALSFTAPSSRVEIWAARHREWLKSAVSQLPYFQRPR